MKYNERFLSFFQNSYFSEKSSGTEFNLENDFNELRFFVDDVISNSITEVGEKLEFTSNFYKNIVFVISQQIFEFISIPLLYTANKNSINPKKSIFHICKKELLEDIFINYPEAERLLFLRIDLFIIYFTRLHTSLIKDKNALYKKFGINSLPNSVEWPLGDFHNGGKTHAIITFNCGKSIVYKTKQDNCKALFEELIIELNNDNLNIPYIFPKRLGKENYYWEEFVQFQPVIQQKKIEEYYETCGKYLGIFYLLGVSDIINDNIIAYDGIPIFIDFEIALKPKLIKSDKELFPTSEFYIQESVIGTGLLPYWVTKFADEGRINFGGLSMEDKFDEKTQLSYGTNGKIEYIKQTVSKPLTNLPFQREKQPNVLSNQYYKQVIDGFQYVCNYVILNKNNFNKKIIHLVNKYKPNVRVLMRHTFVYQTILQESLHPDYLSKTETRYNFLRYLNNAKDEKSFPEELIKIEIEDIRNLDIPIFYVNPKDNFLKNNDKKFFIVEENGINGMRRRVEQLSKKILKQQSELISKSFACYEIIEDPLVKPIQKTYIPYKQDISIDLDQVKTYIEQIAEDLIERSLIHDNCYQWIDISVNRASFWEITAKKPGLYDGLEGIGFFFLYLYKITQTYKYKKIALLILKKSLKAFDNFNPEKKYYLFSTFNYPFSTLYLLWHYEKVTGETVANINQLILTKLYPYIIKNIKYDIYLDVLKGSAGLLIFLLDLYKEYQSKALQSCLHVIYNHIYTFSNKTKNGVKWNINGFNGLISFAHGNAGFLLAIVKYHSLFPNNDKLFVNEILKYNKSLYNKSASNWKDLRYNKNSDILPSWCHGVSGILLSYLSAKKLMNLPTDYINWNNILSFILEKGMSRSLCLCHGILGNVEAALAISKYLNNEETKSFLQKFIYQKMLTFNKPSTLQTGFTNGKYNITGLMLGTSGIGYGLMKTFWEDQIPSILTLEPPL